MKIALRERALATALIVPTAIVVIVLAVLQYRWSNQVSNATSVRLADSLQMSMINWHLNLFRDLSDICAAMRIDMRSVDREALDQQVRRFEQWRASAPYPGLVSQLYILPSASPTLPAVRLNPSSGHFESAPRPAQWNALRSDLQRASAPKAPLAWDGSAGLDYPSAGLEGWRFEPSIPALLRPVVADAALFGDQAPPGRDVAAWLIVELDGEVIRARVLPDLANRYFSGADGLDYQVALVAGATPRRVVYSSDPTFSGQDSVDADGRMNLFGRSVGKTLGSPIYVFHEPSENTGPATSVGTSWFPLLRNTPADEDWLLVVRHLRGGPLGTFVAEMHRRDLAISFGVLLLLVVSMTMWIIVSNRAQRLARLQMDFVTAVTHELRTPLTIIGSAADNIASGVVHEKQQLAQYGSVIVSQARKLSELVEQVLLFAATRQAPQPYVLRPVDVAEVIDTTLTVSADLIQASDVIVDREIEPTLPLVMGDPLALSQCLQNLITNALKYGSEQRWLGVRAVLSESASGREIQVSVSDRGAGIAPSDLPHIFKPFYRSPSTTAAQIHGTGLGLTLARSIAEAMKGQLTVTSVPGRGSTFTLHVPCVEPAIVDAEASLSVAQARQRV